MLLKCVYEEAQRVQRLTQIVFCCCLVSRLGDVGFLSRLTGLLGNMMLSAELVDEIDVLETQGDGTRNRPRDAVGEVGGGRHEHKEHRAQRHVYRITFHEERHRSEEDA